MAIVENVVRREKNLLDFHKKHYFGNLLVKEKPRLTANEKKDNSVAGRKNKLTEHCVECGKSFLWEVKRKILFGQKRGTRRTNYCVDCYLFLMRKRERARRSKWNHLKGLLIKKQGGCCKCGYADYSCMAVFDFHHHDENKKDFAISVLLNFGYSLTNRKLFIKEAAKCKIFCSNCHRKIHTGEMI